MRNFLTDRIRLGVAYYPEQIPPEEWKQDARLMAEMGLDTIRIGEFCWSRMQKGDGTLTLKWIEDVIALFALHNIQTILCTPTATPPIWAVERFPDLPLVTPDGRVGEFGGRRHYSPFHEEYRKLSVDIAAALAERFGRHESVIGWQIDNEVGSYSILDCSAPALAAFHSHIGEKYGTVEELNRRWGLIFWNQEVELFDQVPAPTEMMTTRSPQMLLEYNRFCLDGWAEFIQRQAEVIREHAGAHQFITSNCEESVGNALFARQETQGASWLDYAAVDNYPELLPEPGQNAMRLDRQRCIGTREEFFALELQVGSGYTTTGGLAPEARRCWAFEILARGARLLAWFHWRRFRAGCEWRLTGIVERDRRKRATYDSLRVLAAEIRRIESILVSARVVADVQILYSQDNAIARDRASEPDFWMAIQLPDGVQHRFPLWEKEVRRAIYLPLAHRGVGVRFVTERDEWDPAKPLFVPDIDICTDVMAKRLRKYCETGGTLVCFPGAGERDEDGCQLDACPPGRLSVLFGVELADYYPLRAGTRSTFDPATGKMTATHDTDRAATGLVVLDDREFVVDVRHAEVLAVRNAEILGRYHGEYVDGGPAISQRRVGKGRAVYLGAVPADDASAGKLFAKLLPAIVANEPAGYRRVKLVSNGQRYEFLFNDGHSPCMLSVPVEDVISQKTLPALPPYGVALTLVDRERK